MAVGPTNASITLQWFKDSGEKVSKYELYDTTTHKVWVDHYPKKKDYIDPIHNEIVLGAAKITLTEIPKHDLSYNNCLFVLNGKKYRPVDMTISRFFNVYINEITIAETAKDTP